MKKWLKIGSSILLVMILTMAAFNLFKDTNTVKDGKNKEVSKVNIALVNEDSGSIYNKKKYSLGKNYVEGVEQDSKYNWSVVSRAVAESGLKEGDYNLLVVVPSNFSQNILAINNKSPKSEQITYKVNGKGDKALEERTKKVGDQIIDQLNKKLTNVYMASILTNLYTAQQNVRKVVGNQGEHILGLNNSVIDPISTHQSDVSNLNDQAEGISNTSSDFSKTLVGFIDTTNSNFDSNKEFSDDLNVIIQEKQRNDINYADFVSLMMKLNNNIVSDDTNALYKAVSDSKDIYNSLFNEQNGTFNSDIDSIKNEINANEEAINKISDQIKDNINNSSTTAEDYYGNYFGGNDKFQNLTVKDFLYADSNSTINSKLNSYELDSNSLNSSLLQMSNENTINIPQDSSAVDSISAELGSYYQEIKQTSNDINSILNNSNFSDLKFADEQSGTWSQDVITKYQNMITATPNKLSQKISLNSNDVKEISIPKGIVVDNVEINQSSISYSNSKNDITFDDNIEGNVVINYHFDMTKIVQLTENSKWVLKNAEHKEIDSEKIDYVSLDPNVKQTILDYQDAVTTLKDHFDNSKKSLDLILSDLEFHGNENEIHSKLSDDYDEIMNTNISDYLLVLGKGMTGGQFTDFQKFFNSSGIILTLIRMKATLPQLIQDNQTAIEASKKLNDDVNSQLKLLKDWQNQTVVNNETEKEVDSNNQKLGSDLNEKNESYKSLLEASSSLNDNAKSNAESSSEMAKTIEEYRNSIKIVKATGEELVQKSNDVKQGFKTESNNDQKFSGEFNGVLSNATINGASNDKLLGFLVNPINSSSEVSIQHANVNVPYKIILVMFVLSIMITLLIYKINTSSKKNSAIKEQGIYANELSRLMINVFASTVIGFMTALLIRNTYGISIESVIPLFMLFISYQLLFGLVNQLLFKLFKLYGIGISLFMVIGYALTADIGVDLQSISFIQRIVFGLNPMTSMHQVMITFFTQSTDIWIQIIEAVLMIFVISIGIIFIKMPTWIRLQRKVNVNE